MILIPAYNSAKHLPELISRIDSSAPEIDILIVNDGSTDNSTAILDSLHVKYIDIECNRGKGYALQKGYEYAINNSYDYVLTFDSDLQHLPEEIPLFLDRVGSADLVIGVRDISSRKMPYHRKLSNRLTTFVISFFSTKKFRDSQSGFRMISTELQKRLNLKSVKYDYESEQLFEIGKLDFRLLEIPITTVYTDSESHISHFMDTLRFIKLTLHRIFS
ncbi:MAG: glycosyltransferase family 2 protein [Candidatus Zixiibacteriota bacterium]